MPLQERKAGAGVRLMVLAIGPDEFLQPVRALFPDLAIACGETEEDVRRIARDLKPEIAFVYRVGLKQFPRQAIFDAGLRWIQLGGAGIDYLTPWDPSKLTVTNASGLTSDTIAQFTIGAILAFASRIVPYLRQQVAREWRIRFVESVRGKTVVVVGLGHIGRAVAEKAVALGMRAVGVRAHPKPEKGLDEVVGMDRLHDALAKGDVVVVACPLTPETRGLFGRRAFGAMKPGALFINVARGPIVDESALLEALRTGHLGGAALDVFEKEPLPPESPFWTMENVLVTPHCISDVREWKIHAGEMFCRNLENWLAGRPLFNVVDPNRGY